MIIIGQKVHFKEKGCMLVPQFIIDRSESYHHPTAATYAALIFSPRRFLLGCVGLGIGSFSVLLSDSVLMSGGLSNDCSGTTITVCSTEVLLFSWVW